MLFVESLKPLKIYRKPLYLPTVEDNKKKKSAIFLLTPNYESSKSLITSPLLINKLRFQSYYIEKDLTYFISSKVMNKVDDVTETYVRDYSEVDFYQSLCEMSAAERNKLKDSDFGLPKKRKYPLNDKSHVKSAIKFFNYVDSEDEVELAKNLNKAINKYYGKDDRPKVGDGNRFKKYYHESVITERQFDADSHRNYVITGDLRYVEDNNNYLTGIYKVNTKLPSYINTDKLEDHIDGIFAPKMKSMWKSNKGSMANRVYPFKFYTIVDSRTLDSIVNSDMKKISFSERMSLKAYQYNFERETRRYSIIITATKKDIVGLYYIDLSNHRLIPIKLSSNITESFLDETTKYDKVYHISENYKEEMILDPRVPDNFMTKNKYEDSKTARVCFSSSIDGCLAGLSQNIANKEFYVYIPSDKVDLYKPSLNEVPDAKITGEVWCKSKAKVKCIGKISVTDAKDKPKKYYYGGNVAELYYWNWKWIEKFNESSLLEYADISNLRIEVDKIADYRTNYKFYNGKTLIGSFDIAKSYWNDDLWIVKFEVEKKYRNRGYGEALLRYAIDNLNCTYLQVDKDNRIALELYKKLGFRVDRTDKDKKYYYMRLNKSLYNSMITESVLTEATKYENSFKNDNELYEWMKQVDYKSNGTYDTSKIERDKAGDCHDQAGYLYYQLKKMGYKAGRLFMMEYHDGGKQGGRTHTACWYIKKDKYYWIETAWYGMEGIHECKDLKNMRDYIFKNWKFSGKHDRLMFDTVKGVKDGMSLGEYVSHCVPENGEPKHWYQKGRIINSESASYPISSNERGYYNIDGTYNCLVDVEGVDKPLRGRGEILILDKTNTKIYLVFKDSKHYKVPGGGFEPDESHLEGTVREAKEEARIEVVGAYDTGVRYVEMYKDNVDKSQADIDPENRFYGAYTEVYIGTANDIYDGELPTVDVDDKMTKGRFYPISEVYDKLTKPHKEALSVSLTESALDLSTLRFWHMEHARSGFNPKYFKYNEPLSYYDTIDKAIDMAMPELDLGYHDTVHAYTLGGSDNSDIYPVYVGDITVYHTTNDKYDWEWAQRSDVTDGLLSYYKDEIQRYYEPVE